MGCGCCKEKAIEPEIKTKDIGDMRNTTTGDLVSLSGRYQLIGE